MVLTPWLVRYGYSQGAFPMGEDDGTVNWYEPVNRALIPIEGIRISRSFARTLRRANFSVTFDHAFEDVIRSCRRPDENWINEEIIQVFLDIHREGWAHSCEVWSDGQLIGGIYGLALGAVFSAESMFHRKTDMSKVALWAMVNRCRESGFQVFDAQIMNPHLASLGAYEVLQKKYLELLEIASRVQCGWSCY